MITVVFICVYMPGHSYVCVISPALQLEMSSLVHKRDFIQGYIGILHNYGSGFV